MALSIFYTQTAKETLSFVYGFIEKKFGTKVANSFVKKAEAKINLIAVNPLMYKSSLVDIDVRVATITKQTSLFYQVQKNKIVLLFFWDNRQEPFIES